MPKAAQPDNAVSARILVTCDASPLGAAAIDAAAALARRLDAELAGLFVEDINLLRMAGLPFAREYALASAAARKIESEELERTLRKQAEVLRASLARTAQALSVPWSFQVVRGALLDSVLEAMRAPDLAVFGYTGQFAVIPNGAAARPVPRVTRTAAVPQPILALYDGTPAGERTLRAAQLLAQANCAGLVVLLIAPNNEAAARLREQAAAQLQGGPIAPQFQAVTTRDSNTIRKAVETRHGAALLWHGVDTPEDRKSFNTLVDALKCPVVLVL